MNALARRLPPVVRRSLGVLGVCLLVAAVSLGVGGIRFELAYAGPTDAPESAAWQFDYADLTPDDQAVIERAIAGERIVGENHGQLAGPGRGSLALDRDGEWLLFTRRSYFDPTTPLGTAAVAAAAVGLALVVAGLRDQHRR